MSTQNLSIILQLKDQATKELEGFKGRVESMQPTFKKMAIGGTVAFGAITAGVMSSVKAFQEQERAEKRLEQIATQVTGATSEQIQGYKNLASELQKVGVVGDEVIIAGQSQIASFTKNADVVSLLSNDLADLAVATYGVDVSQEQSIQTANLLGKALGGQLGALTRTGILVNDDFREAFENANTEMERAEIISQIVAENYGGLNEAMRETSEGGMQALKNSMGDLNEQFGELFVPLLIKAVEVITPFVEKISDWVTENPTLARNIILVSGALVGLVAFVGILGLLLPSIMVGFALLASPMLGIIALAGLIIASFSWLILNWEENLETLKWLWDGFLYFLEGIFNKVMAYIRGEIDKVKESFNTAVEFLRSVLNVLKDAFFSVFNFIKEKAIDPVIDSIQRLIDMAIRAKEAISDIGGKAVGGIKNTASGLWNKARSVVGVNDAIISPRGDIITTHPDDYLIATKNPQSLGGGGVTITGNTFLSEDVAEMIGDMIMKKGGLSMKY